jgi:hypothetical protein
MAAKKTNVPRETSGPLKGQPVPKKYRSLPASDFALGRGRYPINTPLRARDALSRIAANGTPAQQAIVQKDVRQRYPSIAVAKTGKGK